MRAKNYGLLIVLSVAGIAKAQGPLPAELVVVPTDAAIVFHLDVATVWKSKIGESIRSMPWPDQGKGKTFAPVGGAMAKPTMKKEPPQGVAEKPAVVGKLVEEKLKKPYYEEMSGKLKEATGLDIADFKSITVFFPKLKGPGDEQTFCFIFTLNKAYDAKKILSAPYALSQNKALQTPKEVEPGVYEFVEGKEPALKMVLKDPMRIVFTGPKFKGVPTVQTGEGPVTTALKAAAAGATLTFNINFAQLPEEIRGDDLPPEIAPYKPLLQSQGIMVTGKMEKEALVLSGRVKTESPRKAGDAEKAMGNLLTLGRLGFGAIIKQFEKDPTNQEAKVLLPLIQSLLDGLNSAQTGTDANDATLSMKVKTDVNAGALLAMVGLPGSTGSASARMQSQNNMKQISLAMHNYESAMGRFPAAAICDKKGKPLLSWRVAILPYIEQDALYKQFKLDEAWDSTHNKKLLETVKIKTYMMPGMEDSKDNLTHYKLVIGKECIFNTVQSLKIFGVTDGLSNTAMLVTAAEGVPWTKPEDIVFDSKADMKKLLLFNNGITSVAFGDGSIRAIKETISEKTLKAIFTASGGEVVDPDE